MSVNENSRLILEDCTEKWNMKWRKKL